MTQAPPFDPTMFGGSDDVPPQPATVAWEALNANDYRTTLEALAQWLQWLVPTYRIPPSVIPPCWFLHSGLIEELGHLWTGWQVTRHPESGIGLIGLDWDSHRERATARLRDLVATSGCNGTGHSTKSGPRLNRDEHLWQPHLEVETAYRNNRSVRAGMAIAAMDALLEAENLEQRAHSPLGFVATDPSDPTAQELDGAIERTLKHADVARRNVEYAVGSAKTRTELCRARAAVVASILDDDALPPPELTEAWLRAVGAMAPTEPPICHGAEVDAAETAQT